MGERIIIQVVGHKNAGKTTLICRFIERWVARGFRVGTIKHDAHSFEMDYPGKDTWKHREAGAEVVAITAKHQTAIIKKRYTPIEELLEKMPDIDIVLIEGFKLANYPKIVILKNKEEASLFTPLENVIAIASWVPGIQWHDAPVFQINDLDGILGRIEDLFERVSLDMKNP